MGGSCPSPMEAPPAIGNCLADPHKGGLWGTPPLARGRSGNELNMGMTVGHPPERDNSYNSRALRRSDEASHLSSSSPSAAMEGTAQSGGRMIGKDGRDFSDIPTPPPCLATDYGDSEPEMSNIGGVMGPGYQPQESPAIECLFCPNFESQTGFKWTGPDLMAVST
ncbi:hypothetical protein N7478_001455 [Penicillium angulare]|uniref:uncharacterized protein n=1 Tax=Penicillium angulare TaxID=116970 RepID=UPI00253FBB91|nr:uncharacterized protein N7478_001386 [Penicillium angulare]XP_056785550.1 uncharacterized protein N7478_001455 [Penicillium angulare]KAJ5292135.1 hypothetical protein N7478_001386 [Penicillium angulare]KAJ5292204.1 hypothetical protein N7478_001455 [Penicillium angulare]